MVTFNVTSPRCETASIYGEQESTGDRLVRFDGTRFTLDNYKSTTLIVFVLERGIQLLPTDDEIAAVAKTLGLRNCAKQAEIGSFVIAIETLHAID